MTIRPLLVILVLTGLASRAGAQEEGEQPPVQFRAVLHDPVRPTAKLFYTDGEGAVVPLNFRPRALTGPLLTVPVNGSIVLYDKPEIDPEDPTANVAASAKLPADLKRAMIVVMPNRDGEEPAYRMLVIDDSEKAFQGGESRVLPLIGLETAVQAGEHRLAIRPGKIARIPPVEEVNDFNMAQTNFYYRQDGRWHVFAERQLQYLDALRRLFIVHATPGALAPTVTTIVDTAPVAGRR